jgi:hypothetical protein
MTQDCIGRLFDAAPCVSSTHLMEHFALRNLDSSWTEQKAIGSQQQQQQESI